jgi:hypothetical protein
MRPRKRHTQTKHIYTQDHSDLLELFKQMDKKDKENNKLKNK